MMTHHRRLRTALAALVLAHAPALAQIEVRFTRPIDSSLARSPAEIARHDADVARFVAGILDRAERSIDMAMYSLNARAIVDALTAAHRRGVRVRVVAHVANRTSAASRFDDLAAAGIPIATNPLAADTETQPLMHHKFFVVDAGSDDAGASPTVVSGSWNATSAQGSIDANNVVAISDPAIAAAYRREFEEMWGSDGATPDAARARFGAAKRDDTDHRFTLADGTVVELYFSPSDDVEPRIRDAITTAGTSVHGAMLTLTSTALASRLRVLRNRDGVDVRLLIENVDDQGSQYPSLRDVVEVRSTAELPGMLHHKYAIVDASDAAGDPLVVTGSYNWTYAASSRNDENTLVIRSERVAREFLQEFAARYREAGGTRGFGRASIPPAPASQSFLSPDPFDRVLRLAESLRCDVDVTMHDAIGRVITRTSVRAGDRHLRFDGAPRSAGPVVVTFADCDGRVRAFLLMHRPSG